MIRTLMLVLLMATYMAPTNQPQAVSKRGPTQTARPGPEAGQQAFQRHCSRCHTAPEQISPHISGSVERHMRVRANLPEKDAKDILRFLAP